MGVFAYCVLVFLFLILYKYGLVSSIYIAMSIIFFIMLKLISKMNNGISKISKKILLSVDKGISFFFDFAYPGVIILASFLFVLVIALSISCVPLSLLRLLDVINISDVSILFISIALGSISCVYCPKVCHWILKKYSPLKDWREHQYQKFQIDLAIYVVSGKNINLLVNLLYLTYLFFAGFFKIQYHTSLINDSVDYAILKAFLVFMAFSGMVRAYKDNDISPEELSVKMLNIILSSNHYSLDRNIDLESDNNNKKGELQNIIH